jgi:hypothetical protein
MILGAEVEPLVLAYQVSSPEYQKRQNNLIFSIQSGRAAGKASGFEGSISR